MLGYSHDELLGRKLWEIGSFKDIAASQISFQELQSKEYIRYEDLPLETKAGERRQVEFISNLYLVDHTKVIQCNIRDITARKLAEARVQQANEQLSSLVTALQRRDGEMTTAQPHERSAPDVRDAGGGLSGHRLDGRRALRRAERLSRGLSLRRASTSRPSRGGVRRRSSRTSSPWKTAGRMRRGRPHEVMDPQTSLLCTHFVRIRRIVATCACP